MSYESPIKIGYAAEPEEGWTDKIGKYIAGEVDNLVLESCVNVGCHVDKDELEKALRYDRGQYEKGYEDGKRDAAAAIEALNRLLDQNTQRCEALRKQLREAHESYERHLNELEAQLPKRGEWIRKDAELYYWHECSKCGERPLYDRYANKVLSAYCPNCGAKMEVQDG